MRKEKQNDTTIYSFADAVAKTFFLSMVSLFCFYSALWMAQDIFPEWQLPFGAKVWLNVLVILTVAVYEIGIQRLPRLQWQWCCRLLVPLIYVVLVCRYVKRVQIDFEDGACALAVQFVDKYNKHLHTSFSMWRGKQEFIGMSFSVCMLGVSLALLILALIWGRRIFLLLLPAAVLAAELLIGYTPKWQGLACFFEGAVLAFAGEWDSRQVALHVHRGGRKQRSGGQILRQQFWRADLAFALIVTLAVGGAVLREPAERLMEKSPQVREFQKKTEQRIAGISNALFTARQENVNNQTPHYTGKEVLKITASKRPAVDLYLKGFCGTDYENGRWVCHSRAFDDACKQAGYEPKEAAQQLQQAGYEVLAYSIRLKSMLTDSYWINAFLDINEIDYEIEYTGLYNKYAYLPYFTDYASSPDKARISGDLSLEKSRNQEKNAVRGWNYDVNVISVAFAEAEDGGYDKLFQWYNEFANSAYRGTSDRVPSAEDFLCSSMTLDENLMMFMDYSTQNFDSLRGDVRQWINSENSAVARNIKRLQLAEAINSLLRQRLDYSLRLDPLPDGADAIEYFLSESHKGYCVHFASAATLMLRGLGIPARYASGYVARMEKFYEKDGKYVVSVKDRNAHAWTEIYLENIGWVPIDVTPGDPESALSAGGQQADAGGQGQQAAQSDDTKAEEDGADTDTLSDDTGVEEDGADTQPDDTKAHGGRAANGAGQAAYWIRTVLLLAGMLLLVLFFIWAVRKAVRRYHEFPQQEIKNGQRRKAVIRMNHRLYRRLRMHGKIYRGNLTDAEYGQVLEAAYEEVLKEDWKRYMRIVKEAAFSDEEPEEEDAYFCYHLYRKLK